MSVVLSPESEVVCFSEVFSRAGVPHVVLPAGSIRTTLLPALSGWVLGCGGIYLLHQTLMVGNWERPWCV